MHEQARIIVVDDQAGMRDFLRYLLEGEGYEIEVAGSGAEALTKLERQPFDLVLADVDMPGTDGVSLLRCVKESDGDIGVIVIAAASSLDAAIQAVQGYADNYLTKPLDDPDVVIAAVQNALAERREMLRQ
jgi:DNA-binding NtrC family response regulator